MCSDRLKVRMTVGLVQRRIGSRRQRTVKGGSSLRRITTLLLPRCCYLAILASNTEHSNKAKQSNQPSRTLYLQTPPCQSTETRLEYNQARNLQLSVTATTAPVAPITTPVDLAANAIDSTAFAWPTSIPPTRPHDISSTSPPFPTGGEWDHPPLRGRPRRPTPPHSKENETSQPTPRRESGVRGVGFH
jgi:hypothetical protein